MATLDVLHQLQLAAGEAIDVTDSDERGWYLYGLTRTDAIQGNALEALPELDHEPTCFLTVGLLSAVVRSVPLAEFTGEALRMNVQDTVWLEAMVRHHHQVLDVIHRRHVVLPSKFGCVYGSAQELAHALAQEHDVLLARLEHMAGCDEWGVHVTIPRMTLERLAQQHDETMQALLRDIATATPGRAYLLRRKLADALSAARERAEDTLALEVYRDLARYARSGEFSTPTDISSAGADGAEETETVMRAVFLVPRTETDRFLAEGERFSAHLDGVRCHYTGPWPPYSFAALADGGKHE